MFAGNPILDEIKVGFKLRPTKTVDKSKPIFLAEGEVADFSSAIEKSKELKDAPKPTVHIPKTTSSKPSWKDKAVTPAEAAPDFPGFGTGGVPPPPPPPPPMNGMPAPPPPPPPAPVVKKPLNPKLLKLGGAAAPSDEDIGALLKSIQGGLKLRKTETNDKSGLVIDDDLRQNSVKLVEPTGPPPELLIPRLKPSSTGRRSQLTPNTLSPKGVSSEDERYLTPDERDSDYGTPEPEERPRSKWSKTPEPEPKKIDFAFDEKNLKVTTETLEQEIPKGLAASKIAKWLQAENVDGGSTISRPSFRPSPGRLSSPFNEVNNNGPSLEQLKAKSPSKWAVVDTGGLKRPGQGNVPISRETTPTPRPTTPKPYRDRTGSNLDAPTIDRARTASPTLEFTSTRRRSSARESSPEVEESPPPIVAQPTKKTLVMKKAEPVVAKQEEKKEEPKAEIVPKKTVTKKKIVDGATKKGSTNKSATPLTVKIDSTLNTPLSINTDFASPSRKSPVSSVVSSTKPEIKETPPTPKHTTKTNGYSYKKTERVVSPPPLESHPSPVSSMSSASVPSPSSISPGSTSPDQMPRRSRPINPNFDKAKEKFATGEVSNATPSGIKAERLNRIGNVSVKDNPFAKSASPSISEEAQAIKKTVREGASKRVINVPISAPWHTPSDSYSSTSPSYSSRESCSPTGYNRDQFLPSYSSIRSFDFPLIRDTASWRNRDSPSRMSVDVAYTPKYSGIHPDDLHRNYRFNIDLSSDSPLSISRR